MVFCDLNIFFFKTDVKTGIKITFSKILEIEQNEWCLAKLIFFEKKNPKQIINQLLEYCRGVFKTYKYL